MLSNQKSSRFYSVKGIAFLATALALLMSVTAFASGNSRFAFIDSATEFFGLQSNIASVSQTDTTTQTSNAFVNVPVSLPGFTTQAAGTVSFPITVGDLTGLGVISYDLNVDFDPAVMVPASPAFTQSGTLSSTMSVTPNTGNPGHMIISAFQGSPIAPGGTLLILNFNIVGAPGTTTGISFADYTDPGPAFHPGFVFNEGDPTPSPITNGSFTVLANTATNTNTPTPSNTATNTPTGTNSPTSTSTATNTPTPTATFTPSSTATNTSTPTPTPLCAQIDIDDKITTQGSQVTLSMTTTNTSSLIPQAFSTDTHVTYDPSMLSLDLGAYPADFAITKGAVALSNGSNLLVTNPSPGLLVISLFSTSAYSGAGSLVDLHFIALGTPGSFTPVYFTPWTQPPYSSSDADGFKYNEGFPTTCLMDGSVAISGTVTGNITYGNSILAPSVRHIPNTTVDGFGAPPVTGLSDSVGNYFLSGFGAGAYNIIPSRAPGLPTTPTGPGPNTHGTSISANDAAKTQQRVVGLPIPWTPIQTFVADVTGSDGVTSLDATAIATWVVNLPTNYYQSGNWKYAPAITSHAFVGTVTDNFIGYLMGEVTGNWCDPVEFGPGQCNPLGYTVAGSRQGPQRLTEVGAASVNAPAGSDIVVPVNVTGVRNKEVISYQFDLRYDSTVIQPSATAVTLANTVSNRMYVVTNATTPGVLRVAVYGAYAISDDAGVLLNFHFNAVGTPFSVSPVTFENFMFNEGSIRTNLTNGQVRLTPAVANTTVAD